jgi:deoxyuridine 5'-triphosphate nucleotidohydrolase
MSDKFRDLLDGDYRKSLEAKFYKLDPNAKLPEFKTPGSACCDLYTIREEVFLPQTTGYVRTGLVCIPPEGYHWQLYLRSSVAKNYPGLILSNHVGIIDEDYCGIEDEVLICCTNTSFYTYSICSGERICQMRLVPTIQPIIKEVGYEEISARSSRGGLGSTGK